MPTETIEQRTARLRALRLAAETRRPREEGPSYPVYGMRDELRFGRRKGEVIEDVLESDPGWIRWALENVRGFAVDETVEEELRYLDDPRRSVERGR